MGKQGNIWLITSVNSTMKCCFFKTFSKSRVRELQGKIKFFLQKHLFSCLSQEITVVKLINPFLYQLYDSPLSVLNKHSKKAQTKDKIYIKAIQNSSEEN